MPRDSVDFVVGDRVPGTKWVMRGKLGEGGMALVLDVVKEPGIQGAMKVMHPEFAKRPEFVSRFFDEVRLLSQLRHPNIVQVFDFDRLADGTPFVVMERLRGVTLRAGLRNLRAKRTPISAKLVYEVTRQMCEGLFRAHSHSPVVVHRDVKPENIFFHQPDFADTVVKVIDFGVAAVLDGTRDQRVFGTPRHMAPEQIRGQAVSPATDVYAAALVLYELLTGRFPWDVDLRNELAIIEAHMRQPPAPPSRYTPWIPPRVDQWIVRALAKSPRDRPQDAYQFVAKLYELQFVNDGTSDSIVDIHTTAPTLARLAEAIEGAAGTPTRRDDIAKTSRDMFTPPIEGPAPEAAPAEFEVALTDPRGPPTFSDRTMERAARATLRPPAGVDRSAPTRSRPLTPWPPPTTDTAVLSPSRLDPPFEPDDLPPEFLQPPADVPIVSPSGPPPSFVTSPRSIPFSRDGILPAALGATLVVGLFVAIVSVNRPRSAASTTPVVEARAMAPTSEPPPPPLPKKVPPPEPPVQATAAPDDSARNPLAAPSSTRAGHAVPGQRAAFSVGASTASMNVASAVVRSSPPPHASAHPPDDGRELLYVRP